MYGDKVSTFHFKQQNINSRYTVKQMSLYFVILKVTTLKVIQKNIVKITIDKTKQKTEQYSNNPKEVMKGETEERMMGGIDFQQGGFKILF